MREQTFKGKTVTVESKIDHAARLAAALFAFQEWTYGWDEHIPGREELADTIKELLKHAAEGSGGAGTGRLHVAWNDDFQRYEITLEIGTLTSQELYEETGIDRMVSGDLTEEP